MIWHEVGERVTSDRPQDLDRFRKRSSDGLQGSDEDGHDQGGAGHDHASFSVSSGQVPIPINKGSTEVVQDGNDIACFIQVFDLLLAPAAWRQGPESGIAA
jgi:hypothetical protein